MSLKSEAIKRVGELIITGIEGKTLTKETQAALNRHRFGGIIYFAHNYESPAQIAELSLQIQKSREEKEFRLISVDHEGGRVQRFRDGFTRLPPALKIGASRSPKLAFEIAELTAKELASVGINLNFAPDADLFTEPTNPVIGDRSFGSDPEETSKIVSAVVRGHLSGGVQPCVKHFPGHGDTTVDSHFELPKIKHPLSTLRSREFIPFTKAFKAKCGFVMSAHVINSEIDPEFPATLSKKTLQEILRKELRYNKIILSDDMEMHAITKHFGAEDAPILAIQAGVDMLIYRTLKAALVAVDSLTKAVESDRLHPTVVLDSANRVLDARRTYFADYVLPDPQSASKSLQLKVLQDLIEKLG